jgi:hypothetical protein
LPTWLLARLLAFRLQAAAFGGLDAKIERQLRTLLDGDLAAATAPFVGRSPVMHDGIDLKPGALLAREWRGRLERVTVLESGFAWNGATYGSLSQVAKAITGTSWNGHRFFGLNSGFKSARKLAAAGMQNPASAQTPAWPAKAELLQAAALAERESPQAAPPRRRSFSDEAEGAR